jgi:hypothetical protein
MNSKGKGNAKESGEAKVRRGRGIVEKNKNRRGVEKSRKRRVQYSTIGDKVVTVFIIIFRMCTREGI